MGPNDILYTSVDHLPAEMPVEASNHFGSRLLPFIPAIVNSSIDVPFADQILPPEIKNAVMTCNGELTPKFKYVEDLRAANEA
jgi:alpha-aminoadipic semialdehyde synthase